MKTCEDTGTREGMRMGYGVSLHRFVGGEPEVLDDRVIRDVLAPHVARAGRDAGELLVRAADGERRRWT